MTLHSGQLEVQDSEHLVMTVLACLEDPGIRGIDIECVQDLSPGLRGLLGAMSANAAPVSKSVTVTGL